MVKKMKSKNAVIKKAKKLERQGKYKKGIKVCDDFLDKKLDLSILEIKVDLINTIYLSDKFLDKLNNYENTLTYFLSESEEELLLKLYSATKSKMNFYHQSYDNKYLMGGLILDNLEILLNLNIHTEKNKNQNKADSSIPKELKIFKKDIEKTAKQYLTIDNDNLENLLINETKNISKTKHEIKELSRVILTKNESKLEENKTLEENKNEEKTMQKLINKIVQNIDEEKYEEALNYINESLIIDKENIQVLEFKVTILNHMQRFEEALTTQKLIVKIAKTSNKILNKENYREIDKYQTNLFDF